MRPLTLIFLMLVGVAYCEAQTSPPVDSRVLLKISLATDQREFHVGEIIPLQLSFSSAVKDHYQLNMAQYDRSGRMNYERFDVVPAGGAVDPLPKNSFSMVGGLTNFKFLSIEPWTIKLNLNEWVRFTQPGEYSLVVSSNRIAVRDPVNASGTTPVTARSNKIALKIVSANPGWQKQVFTDAVAVLNSPIATNQPGRQESRRRALELLRFLGTADATREMARRMSDEDSGDRSFLTLGLISSPEREVARTTLEELMADPTYPVDSGFLYTLRMVGVVDAGATIVNWRQEQARVVEKLIAALPLKRDKALPVTLSTAVNEAWNDAALPKQITDVLVKQLLSMFDQLPLSQQNFLLNHRWDRIASQEMLPILRRHALAYRDPKGLGEPKHDSLALSGNALLRWYELDPDGARPAIIAEINRPRPRFDARVLGILPDKTIAEVDIGLAEHLAASNDLEGSSRLASLIARYATEAILPQITETFDPLIGKSACDIQNPLLAYLLRVDPAIAGPRIERALAARGKNFTACNQSLFQTVSELHNDPILEELAIHSLDDPDPQVAMTAATMLGKFGSPAAESSLLQRYEKWNEKWAGRERELDVMLGDRGDDRTYQFGLGNNLVQALATGQSWFFDKNKLLRLSGLTTVLRLRQQQMDRYLKMWDESLPTISIDFNSAPSGFHATVAQYEFQSMDNLKSKLLQFPSGTKFMLSAPAGESAANAQTLVELTDFLRSRGFLISAQKREN